MYVPDGMTENEYKGYLNTLKSETGCPLPICMSALSHSEYDLNKARAYLAKNDLKVSF